MNKKEKKQKMISEYSGEVVAIFVSVLWTVSALFYEAVSGRISVVMLNTIRLTLTMLLIGVLTLVLRGRFFPTDAGMQQWLWLGLSGFVGLFLGDLCLFRSYAMIGARTTQLIMSLAPVLTALVGTLALNEKLTMLEWLGVVIVTSGILMTVVGRGEGRIRLNVSAKGLGFATLSMVAQASGFILTKKGVGGYDAFASAQIRDIAALGGIVLLVTARGMWGKVRNTGMKKDNLKAITLGTVFGPFLGVSLSMYAIAAASTGIAAALLSLVPVFILVPTILRKKEHITKTQILGTLMCFAGGCMFFV